MDSKAVLISIHPDWVEHIFMRKDKIYEVRKRAPLIAPPYKVYVYCTLKEPFLKHETDSFKGTINGLIVGEFTCVKNLIETPPWFDKTQGTRLTANQLAKYANGKHLVYMEIENPTLFDKPKSLKEFSVTRPPQSFCYCRVLENG